LLHLTNEWSLSAVRRSLAQEDLDVLFDNIISALRFDDFLVAEGFFSADTSVLFQSALNEASDSLQLQQAFADIAVAYGSARISWLQDDRQRWEPVLPPELQVRVRVLFLLSCGRWEDFLGGLFYI
jgi:hypothetical protein